MSDIPEALERIESTLADMIDAYAVMREKYVRNPADFHSLAGGDRDIALEVCGIRQAAYLIRNHRDETSGMSLPTWLHDEWAAKERAVSDLLTALATKEADHA
ncbi:MULTISPECIES: hypothetical protein [Nocardia]|uniref:hypothetical protein n=1 Tax=Nocardia TaxID=1817 RepID=UPI000ABA1E03|nr:MULTISPECIES: hypothetical protein [Nocardia]